MRACYSFAMIRTGSTSPFRRADKRTDLLVPALVCLCLLVFPSAVCGAGWREQVRRLAGPGGVLVQDSQEKVLFGHNQDKKFIPASILKIVTALAALRGLGPDYRFATEFRLTKENDLIISGRGDPLLISEEIAKLTRSLKKNGLASVRNILLDSSFFAPDLVLDGTARSLNPYDAFNGALSVNFNTIMVHIDQKGRVRSAEKQTPLTPLARKMGRRSGARGRVRLNLADSPETCLLYAGQLFQAFLQQAGVRVEGKPEIAGKNLPGGKLIKLHRSSFPLSQVVTRMMEYSNNFIANQVFLTMGAEKLGPPATAPKAGQAAARILTGLGLDGVRLAEGSGLSRKTRASPATMVKALNLFRPHAGLLKAQGSCRVKTGTMTGVQSLAGYLPLKGEPPAAFVIMLNGPEAVPGKRERVLRMLQMGFSPDGI